MKNGLPKGAKKLNKNHKQRKWWQRAVRVMGTVVVFCTTYALILPAITMERETVCGMEAHEHSESCYIQQVDTSFVCGLDEQVKVVHSHDALCYNAEGEVICLLPELEVHTHEKTCYEQVLDCEAQHVHSEECVSAEPVLICTEEEREAHICGDDCTVTEEVLVCTVEEDEGHSHSDACTGTEQVLICTVEDAEHVHAEDCYEIRQLICEEEEREGHIHGEDCYEQQEVPCALAEDEGHTHGEDCYEEPESSCELTVDEDHVHTEDCYTQGENLTCTKEEIILHTHEESCYDEEGALTCVLPEVIVHSHTEDCLVESEAEELVLVCELPEHIHEDACYPVEEEDENGYTYLCGSGVHTHVETCYDEAGELICTIPEHAHEAACILENLDLTADVETTVQWEEMVSNLTLTGHWPSDILAVAETQLDYKESDQNAALTDGLLHGYTRYGAWYGDPYGKWDAMFVSFCLNYADVQDFPMESDANRWIAALEEKRLYKTPDAYSPAPGDLIFFDFDQKEDAPEEIPVVADQVGIVAELIPAAEEMPAQIKLIAGDQNDQVSYVTCDADDITIVGYADMPFGELFQKTYAGEDYTVTVTLGKDAGIPDTVELSVREILSGTEEYDTYYQQSLDALKNNAEEDSDEPELSFARFFDIRFLVDGVVVEPAAPVDVQIRYSESIAVKEEENGVVVHFAQEGVEVLDADTYNADPDQQAEDNLLTDIIEIFTGETEQVDTFRFTQGSFSVSGTIVTYDARAIGDTYYYKEPTGLDPNGGVQYLFYAKGANGRFYAIRSNTTGTTTPVEITFNDDGSIATQITRNMLWTLSADNNAYIIKNVGTERYLHSYDNDTGENITTGGAYATSMVFHSDGEDIGFLLQSNNDFAQLTQTNGSNSFTVGQSADVATTFFLAAPRGNQSIYHVWFDGTNGGLMNLYGSPNTYREVSANNNVITLPDTWQSPTKYPYKLNGWYDIVANQYYKPGTEVTITQNTVFYADWNAATYDVGQANANVVNSLDTNNFITTYVFDYNTLFNVQSLAHTGTISATSHNETWTLLTSGKVPYNPDGGEKEESLGFMFVDYDANGDFSYAHGRDRINNNQGDDITPGILTKFFTSPESNLQHNNKLLDMLFNPGTSVIGKQYVGQGNYLFQYMDSTTPNYDGEHDGYYYLDARLNAASYNQTNQRFYLYNYLERTSDSRKDGYVNPVGQYSDILPFNSPYLFDANQLNVYNDTIRRTGYEYDAKDALADGEPPYSSTDDAITNYFFGIRSDIEFFLPNNTNTTDEYGNYGNISTRGEHMVFDFHGDDDVWVFVDDELLLDIGGLHGIMHGRIDFSTGTIITGRDGGTITTQRIKDLLGHEISEGTHTMTVYYMERGSSQSNCAIYFNIAPRYDLEIRKEDIVTAEELNDAVFTIYNDEEMRSPAQLWDSEEAHNEDMKDGKIDNAKSSFKVVDGVAKCWGISAGKTYYIYETTPPPGYPASDDMIRITLNNRGTATIETTTLHGSNGIATEGYAVIKQDINETLKIVALTVTNQKEGDFTEVRVEKDWAGGSVNLPQSITVYLTRDGVPYGRRAELTEGNGWSYTWTGLEKYRPDGINQEYVYAVEEVLVPGFITTQGETQKVEKYTDWIRVDKMSDSKTFLLVHNGQALTYDEDGFGWMAPATAEMDTSLSAQWNVTTDHDGFHLKNGLRYTLTFDESGFYGVNDDAVALNQVFYYLNSRLMVHDHDVYYQFGPNGSVVSEDGLAFTLYQKEVITGFLTNITNVPVEDEDQTYVEVTKVWDDGNEKHVNGSVVVSLYADGKDTGRSVVLNAANDWKGGFYDLPYFQEDGKTVVQYTVVEEEVHNYVPAYSDPEQRPQLAVYLWRESTTLSAGELYRFTSGTYAMAEGSDNKLISASSDAEDPKQQWRVEIDRNNNIFLKNVDSGRYLSLNNNTLSTVTNQNSATAVTLQGHLISLGENKYLEISATHVGVTNNAANISNQMVTQYTEVLGKPGTGYTITNLPAIYELPNTGGMGESLFTFGGLLMTAFALMYISKFGRKQQKGGKYHRS